MQAANNKNKPKSSASEEKESLSGAVERVTFHNPDNGFCVLKVKVKGHVDLVCVIGNASNVSAGEYIECAGTWQNDARHGLQFRTDNLRVLPPTTRAGIEKYLASGMIKGIGPAYASRLVETFGDDVFDVIENHPERLCEVEGLGIKRIRELKKAWAEQKSVREIMVFLQSHGIGTARAVRIYKTYHEHAVERVRENPYCLSLDIHGIGFKTADNLAMRLGIAPDSHLRAQAATRHVMQEFAQNGHCAVRYDDLLQTTAELLEVVTDIVAAAIEDEINAERIVREHIQGEPCLFVQSLLIAEQGVAEHITRLSDGATPWSGINIGKAIPWVENKTKLKLSASQAQAVKTALQNKITIITGGPGVGKTTVVNSILRALRAKHIHVVLCAPTGRAAKRMTETTGMQAKTIHRLLEFDPHQFDFRHDEDDPLKGELFVVDETSMVDINLMHSLLCAIPKSAAVLLVGDVDQLPSVGPGAVLANMIDSDVIATVRLTEIFRQAADSHIIINAHRINHGEMPLETPSQDNGPSDFYVIPADSPEEIQRKLVQVVTRRIPQRFKLHPFKDIQVLSPMNRAGLGTRALNSLLQGQLNPDAQPRIERYGWTFAPGDKVIQTVNNYDKDIFNGDIGRITHINKQDNIVTIEFEGRELLYDFNELDEIALAYATTIHKSQGSEYPAVVIPLATQHFTLLQRNLLYTGVTRGKQLVVIVGQLKAIAMAVNNQKSNQRLTRLTERLQEMLPALS